VSFGTSPTEFGAHDDVAVDLPPDLYEYLCDYAQALDVAEADVIRELIRQARANPNLLERVIAKLVWRREALVEWCRRPRK
jgi:hypothetical protein